MFRDIILNLAVDGERDAVRDYALSFARAFEAHLTGVAFAYEPIAPGTIFDGVPEAIIATERAACEEAAQKARQRSIKWHGKPRFPPRHACSRRGQLVSARFSDSWRAGMIFQSSVRSRRTAAFRKT